MPDLARPRLVTPGEDAETRAAIERMTDWLLVHGTAGLTREQAHEIAVRAAGRVEGFAPAQRRKEN